MQVLDLGKMWNFLLSPRTAQTTLVPMLAGKALIITGIMELKAGFGWKGPLKVI